MRRRGEVKEKAKRTKKEKGKIKRTKKRSGIFILPERHYPNSIRVKIPCFKEGKITLFRIGSYLNLMGRIMFLPCTPHFAVVEFCSVSVAATMKISEMNKRILEGLQELRSVWLRGEGTLTTGKPRQD
jgi:hypothetical protein